MIDRLYEILSRFNRLQQQPVFKITVSAVFTVVCGIVAYLGYTSRLTWLPDSITAHIVYNTILTLLAYIALIWVDRGLTTILIIAIAVPVAALFGPHLLNQPLLSRMVLGTGFVLLWFMLLIQAARLALGYSKPVFAIARLVLDEALKRKLALIFIVLAILFIPWLAGQLDPEERLQYRIQTFLSYGMGVSYGLLAVMTVFLSTATVAFEQRDKQIFQVVTKPASRFQYLIGKWIGIVVLDAVLLLVCGGSVFWYTQYLRTLPAHDAADELAVTEQVMTARIGVAPQTPDMHQQAMQEATKEIASDLQYQGADQATINQARVDRANDLMKQWRSAMFTIEPNQAATYNFTGVKPLRLSDVVTADLKSEKPIVINSPIKSPVDVRVSSEDGKNIYSFGSQYQIGVSDSKTYIQLAPPGEQAKSASPIADGQKLLITYYPENALTLRIKINTSDNMPGQSFFISALIPGAPPIVQEVVPVQTQSLLIPAGLVQDDGTLKVTIVNGGVSATGGTLVMQQPGVETFNFGSDGLELMYKVSTFESNFFRSLLIFWIKLGFLSMLGIAAATFASFPVACLLAFTVFFGAETAPFLAESLKFYNTYDVMSKQTSYFKVVVKEVATVCNWVLDVYGNIRPTSNLVEGRLVSWTTVFETFVFVTVVWSGITCLLGWVIFNKRQLAIYSGHA